MARCRPSRAFLLGALLLATTFLSALPSAHAATAADESTFPIRMVGASAAFLNGASYVFGGRLDDGSYSDGVYKVDHATSETTRVATLPRIGTDSGGRQSGAAAVVNGKIYYFGGAALVNAGDLNGDGNADFVPRAINTIVEFNPSTNEVRNILATLPTGAWGIGATSLGTKAFLFGGFSFDITRPDSIERKDWILEFDGSSVANRGKLPYAVQDAAVAHLNGVAYVFGGLSDHKVGDNPCPTYRYYNETSGQHEDKQPTACLTDVIASYNTISGIAGIAGKLPYRAQFLNGVTVGSRIYIPGGALPGPTATASILEFDPKRTEAVTVLTPTLPRGIYGAPVTTDGATITVFGGRLGGFSDLSDKVVRVDPRATAPWAPRTLNAIKERDTVTLTWDRPAYDGGSPVTLYRVYRTDGDGIESLLANVTGGTLQYVDRAASPGIAYAYRVTSVNVAGESAADARVSLTTETTPPGAVDSFEVFPGNEEALLRWLPPTSTGGSPISGYRIHRNGELLRSASVPASATSYVDTGLVNDVAVTYTITAYNAKGDGAASEEVNVTPRAVPSAPRSIDVASVPGGSVLVTWGEPLSGSADQYVVSRGTEPKHLVAIATVTGREYDDADVQQGRTYYYAVSAVNTIGAGPPTALTSVSLVTPPGAPEQLLVSPGQGEIRLTWQVPSDTGGADRSELTYLIWRTPGSGSSPQSIIATGIKGTTYADRFVQPGQTYTYNVTTMNPLMGAASVAKSATAKAVVNELPTAVLAALPPLAQPGDTVELDASQSRDLDGSIARYRFEFGDGTPAVESTTPTVAHVYTVNGTYHATVVAIDNRGAEGPIATAQVVIGTPTGSPLGETGTTVPGRTDDDGTTPDARPGTSNPTPGAGVALVAAAAVLALALRRRT